MTLDYEDGAFRIGGLPDNQTLAFDTLGEVAVFAQNIRDAIKEYYIG